MSASFANLHVRAARDREGLIAQLTNLLASEMARKGFQPANDGRADREIAFGPSGDGWIAILDSDLDTRPGQSMARLLSTRLGVPVVAAAVAQSDIRMLGLWIGGKELALWVTGGPIGSSGPLDADVWRDVSIPEFAETQLPEVWGRDYLLAEEAIADVAELLGASPELMTTGYEMLKRLGTPPGWIVQRWRATETPDWAGPATGPLELVRHSWTTQQRVLTVPRKWEDLGPSVTWRNHGGPDRGMTVEVSGTPIDEGSVLPRQALIQVGNPLPYRHLRSDVFPRYFEEARVEFGERHDGTVRAFADIALPAGFRADDEFAMAQSAAFGGDMLAASEAMWNSGVRVRVFGPTRPGTGFIELHITAGVDAAFEYTEQVEVAIPRKDAHLSDAPLVDRAPDMRTIHLAARVAAAQGRPEVVELIESLGVAVSLADDVSYLSAYQRLLELTAGTMLEQLVASQLSLPE